MLSRITRHILHITSMVCIALIVLYLNYSMLHHALVILAVLSSLYLNLLVWNVLNILYLIHSMIHSLLRIAKHGIKCLLITGTILALLTLAVRYNIVAPLLVIDSQIAIVLLFMQQGTLCTFLPLFVLI